MLPDLYIGFSRGRSGGLIFLYLEEFPPFVVIHTVKGFGIVNEAEIDIFLKLSCFFDDPAGWQFDLWCVYICVYIHIYMCVYIYIYMCVYISVYMGMCLYTHTHTHNVIPRAAPKIYAKSYTQKYWRQIKIKF